MIVSIIIGLVFQLIVPLVLIASLLRGSYASKTVWLLITLAFGAFVGYVVLIGTWGMFGYFWRPILVIGFLAAAVVSLRRVWQTPWIVRPKSFREWTSVFVGVILLFLFSTFLFTALGAFAPGERPVALSYPLEEGVSYVGHGGANPIMNYHNVDPAQRYALDIEELGTFGFRATGILPENLDRYAVYGSGITSPCAGEVLEAKDGLADLTPPNADPENLAGNNVVVRCDDQDVDVALAHMQEGSVEVEEGERVEAGQALGRVGNTGNTSEPHLHIHAVRTGSGSILEGEGVPISFDGRFLVRNSLVF